MTSLPWFSYENHKCLAGKMISVFECVFVSMAAMLMSPVSGANGSLLPSYSQSLSPLKMLPSLPVDTRRMDRLSTVER